MVHVDGYIGVPQILQSSRALMCLLFMGFPKKLWRIGTLSVSIGFAKSLTQTRAALSIAFHVERNGHTKRVIRILKNPYDIMALKGKPIAIRTSTFVELTFLFL